MSFGVFTKGWAPRLFIVAAPRLLGLEWRSHKTSTTETWLAKTDETWMVSPLHSPCSYLLLGHVNDFQQKVIFYGRDLDPMKCELKSIYRGHDNWTIWTPQQKLVIPTKTKGLSRQVLYFETQIPQALVIFWGLPTVEKPIFHSLRPCWQLKGQPFEYLAPRR